LYEAVERHQVMCSWYLRDWPVSELPSQLPEGLRQAVDALGGRCWLFQVGRPPLNTVVAVLAQPDGTQLTCGSAAGPDRQRNCDKAVGEALMLQHSIRTSAAVADLHGAERAETPTSSLEHVLRHYDHGAPVLNWYRSRAGAASAPEPTGTVDPDPQQRWAAVQAALGRDIYLADVADTTARHSGWHVARVLVPTAVAYGVGDLVGQQANSIARVLNELGSAGEVNSLPHPFG
jgi:ribosomal protein S12 methylthiotransferase accessory factor YcaO